MQWNVLKVLTSRQLSDVRVSVHYGTPYKWLDLAKFSRALVPNRYTIQAIKYYTAQVSPLPVVY